MLKIYPLLFIVIVVMLSCKKDKIDKKQHIDYDTTIEINIAHPKNISLPFILDSAKLIIDGEGKRYPEVVGSCEYVFQVEKAGAYDIFLRWYVGDMCNNSIMVVVNDTFIQTVDEPLVVVSQKDGFLVPRKNIIESKAKKSISLPQGKNSIKLVNREDKIEISGILIKQINK